MTGRNLNLILTKEERAFAKRLITAFLRLGIQFIGVTVILALIVRPHAFNWVVWVLLICAAIGTEIRQVRMGQPSWLKKIADAFIENEEWWWKPNMFVWLVLLTAFLRFEGAAVAGWLAGLGPVLAPIGTISAVFFGGFALAKSLYKDKDPAVLASPVVPDTLADTSGSLLAIPTSTAPPLLVTASVSAAPALRRSPKHTGRTRIRRK